MNDERIDEGFICEAVGPFVFARLVRAPTERVLEECQAAVLEAMRRAGSKAVLYDLTDMRPAPINVLLYQQVLNEHIAPLAVRRAIVVPNAQIAHIARLAFAGSDYRLFYDDPEAAKAYLADARPFSGADWSLRVIEERRLRERRAARREPGGRREHDRAAL